MDQQVHLISWYISILRADITTFWAKPDSIGFIPRQLPVLEVAKYMEHQTPAGRLKLLAVVEHEVQFLVALCHSWMMTHMTHSST